MPSAISIGAIPDHLIMGSIGDPLVLFDTFTDVAGTLLSTHTPDKGDSWNIESGSVFDSTGNLARLQSGQAGVNTAWMNGISSNLTMQCTVTLPAGGQFAGMVYHISDSANFLALFAEVNGALTLRQYQAAVLATISTVTSDLIALSSGVAYTFRFESDGSTLDLYVNSTLEISTNDTANADAGQSGTAYGLLQWDNVLTAAWDNFRVSNAKGVLG